MRSHLLRLALAIGLAGAPALAAQAAPTGPEALPDRGRTMAQVKARFGAPEQVHPPVGKPPITRWDYSGFIVVFEHDRVIDSLRPGMPPELHHRDQLDRRPVATRE